MQNNTLSEKTRKWTEYEVLEHVASLREAQKENPAPLVLRSQINDLAIELYTDCYTCIEISKLLSMGKCTVYRVLKRNNIFKGEDRSVPKDVEENVVRMYRQGQEASKISEQLGITIPSVRWLLKKNKIPAHRTKIIQRKKKPDKETLEKAVQMYKEGIPFQNIKDELGINNSHLYDTIHKKGIPMRDGRSIKTKQRIAAEEEALRLYRDTDMLVREIKETTGIAYTTLKRLLIKRNIPFREKPLELTQEQKEEVACLYSEGWTNKAISEKTGIDVGRFLSILQEKNVPLKGRRESAIDKELQEKAILMYRQGYMLKEIRKATGIKDIYDVLKRYNISERRRFGE